MAQNRHFTSLFLSSSVRVVGVLSAVLQVAVIWGLLVSLSHAAASGNVRVAAHEWPPFASPKSQYFGMAPRIASEIWSSQGATVNYQFHHWSDALDGLMSDQFDAAIVWVMADLKHDALLFSEPIIKYRSALYFRNDFPPPKSQDDLLGFRLGVNSRYVYEHDSYRLLANKQILPISISSDVDGFQQLLDGKIDFFLTPLLTSKPLLENIFQPNQQQQLNYTSQIFKFPGVHLVVNRDHPNSQAMIDTFNTGLRRLSNNGTINRYIDDFRFSKY